MAEKILPDPPEGLADGEVTLRFVRVVVPGEPVGEEQHSGEDPIASYGAPSQQHTGQEPTASYGRQSQSGSSAGGGRRESRGLVPYYHFRIIDGDGTDVGHINFRVGDTEHVRVSAGHIGFEIAEPYRGRRLAYRACRAIAPFVRSVYEAVTITSDPDNVASIGTIERLGAEFVDEVAVPPHDPHYASGSHTKRRYRWVV